ncbi:hypothetical protein, partial [Citrobacter freundii]|uniref:hypothetical protein n=1 Tax=Citrobacter freundii TaxID=546 RepID=UPI0019553C26
SIINGSEVSRLSVAIQLVVFSLHPHELSLLIVNQFTMIPLLSASCDAVTNCKVSQRRIIGVHFAFIICHHQLTVSFQLWREQVCTV